MRDRALPCTVRRSVFLRLGCRIGCEELRSSLEVHRATLAERRDGCLGGRLRAGEEGRGHGIVASVGGKELR